MISSLLLIVLLSRKEQQEQQESGRGFEIKVSDVRRVLFDKSLFGFGLVLLGAQIAWGLTLTFVVFYLEDYLKINSSMAGLVGSLSLIFALVAAPVFGRIYDRIRNIQKLLFVWPGNVNQHSGNFFCKYKYIISIVYCCNFNCSGRNLFSWSLYYSIHFSKRSI